MEGSWDRRGEQAARMTGQQETREVTETEKGRVFRSRRQEGAYSGTEKLLRVFLMLRSEAWEPRCFPGRRKEGRERGRQAFLGRAGSF